MSTAVCYCGPVVQLTISEAERQGITGSNPAFCVIFFIYFIITFHFYFIPFIYYHCNYFFIQAFLIMIFPLLVSGIRVGRLCWVGQEPAVFAAVG